MNIHSECFFAIISSCGAIISWSFSPDKEVNNKITGLIKDMVIENFKRKLIEGLAFAIFGALVSMLLIRPETAPQALAGGMAWFSFIKKESTQK